MLGLLRKIDFLKSWFGDEVSAAARAKERLRIVLIQDQSSISPDLLEVLREEMIGVVSRYLEIDLPHLEMGIERKEESIALAATIPIVRIRQEGRALLAETATETNSNNNGMGKMERRHRRSRRHYR